MKRRKIIGLILFTGTLVYLLASLLALFQNQRVVLEKGMEEALKAYVKQEELNVKELNKDFNLMLNEKVDKNALDSQVVKYEGSLARMEKNITHVTDDMANVEYNISQLNERVNMVADFYQSLCDEIIQQNLLYQTLYEEIMSQNQLNETLKEGLNNQNQLYESLYEEVTNHNLHSEEQIAEMDISILSIQKEVEAIKSEISKLEEVILNNDFKQEENVKMLQEQIALCQQRLVDLEGNALFFQYDEETQTLNMFGRDGGQE